MAANTKKHIEPLVLPDVATQAHPIVTIPDDTPLLDPDEPLPVADASEEAPVGDYVRQIQQEYDEQQEEGKL